MDITSIETCIADISSDMEEIRSMIKAIKDRMDHLENCVSVGNQQTAFELIEYINSDLDNIAEIADVQ